MVIVVGYLVGSNDVTLIVAPDLSDCEGRHAALYTAVKCHEDKGEVERLSIFFEESLK